MRRLQRFPGPATLAALVLLVPAVASGQDLPKAKPVEFNTADGVELRGQFYPSGQGKVGPTVLLLHSFGEHSRKAEYVHLAKTLQKAGYCVMTFDFRGHGDSTRVKPGIPNANPMLAVQGFWDYEPNRVGVRGFSPNKPRPTEIEYKHFAPTYHRILVNDIAAAKTQLDQMNDAGECNSGALVLIGAKEGATLGAIWMNSEWHRYKFIKPQPGLPQGALDLQNPEGQNIACAVWLSISTTLGEKGGQKISVATTLDVPGKQRMVPMVFVYGEGDKKGEAVAEGCEKYLRVNKKDYQFTGAMKIARAGGAQGSALISKSLDTDKEIVTYLNNALEGKTWASKSRSNTDDAYFWQLVVNGQPTRVQARLAGVPYTKFVTYSFFAR